MVFYPRTHAAAAPVQRFYNELINNIKHVNRDHHHLWLAGPVRRCLYYYASYRAGSTRVRAYYPGD